MNRNDAFRMLQLADPIASGRAELDQLSDDEWSRLITQLPFRSPVRRGRRIRPLAQAAVIGAILVVGTGSALAATGHSIPGLGVEPNNADRVNAAADDVTGYSADHPGSGYSNVVVDENRPSVTVIWRGPVPRDLQSRLAATGLTIEYQQAPYTDEDFAQANRRLQIAGADTWTSLGVEPVTFGPDDQRQGINFSHARIPGLEGATSATIQQTAEKIAGLPVTHIQDATSSRAQFATPSVPTPRR